MWFLVLMVASFCFAAVCIALVCAAVCVALIYAAVRIDLVCTAVCFALECDSVSGFWTCPMVCSAVLLAVKDVAIDEMLLLGSANDLGSVAVIDYALICSDLWCPLVVICLNIIWYWKVLACLIISCPK
jgi:hypothetical protein